MEFPIILFLTSVYHLLLPLPHLFSHSIIHHDFLSFLFLYLTTLIYISITQIVNVNNIPSGWMGLDIGPKTLADIQAGLADCKTGTGRESSECCTVLHGIVVRCDVM